jgi:dienelactone hydrolase
MPPNPPATPAPLLVVFHKFGSSHGDVLNTTFLAETQARGWYCLAPLGARQKHFGNLESQINTRAALRLAAHLFPIDGDRVYGVGFSMGGGAVANYAAGHLDPTDLRFAAIANHTGGVSLPHTWFHEPDDADLDDDTPSPGMNLEVPDVLEDLFGGAPSAVPFAYLRCSVLDVDPITGVASAQNDLARNLSSIPTYTTIANADPLLYLGTQTYALDGVLQAQAAGHQLSILNGNVHAWTTLDETAICDWLQSKTLQSPLSARTLATENGRWHDFDVEQTAAGAFTPFTWSVDVPTRRVQISQTANLHRLSIHAADLGLPTSGPITLVLSTSDGSGDRARVLGVSGAPTLVTRDGVSATATYDSLTQSVEVVETDGARHEWLLVLP